MFQSGGGRSFSKPTRFLFNLPAVKELLGEGWPEFDDHGKYLGPLERKESFQSLIGKDGGVFRTSAATAWPCKLCRQFSELSVEVAKHRPQQREVNLSSNREVPLDIGVCGTVAEEKSNW